MEIVRQLEDGVVIAESPAMKSVVDLIGRVNAAGSPCVLLQGESGSGKDFLARLIHERSDRSEGPFLEFSCAASSPDALEEELFGGRPQFNGGATEIGGLLAQAHRGTAYLDGVEAMSSTLQCRLARFLDERSSGNADVDVRIIASAPLALTEAVSQGKFRRDLYYRLAVVGVTVPPLRERGEDLGPLVDYFLERANERFGRRVRGVTERALRALAAHPWPGNVRELTHVIERAVVLADGGSIDREQLDLPCTPVNQNGAADPWAGSLRLPDGGLDLQLLERDLVCQALQRTHHNQTRAARLLGMTRDQIRYRIEKFDLGVSKAN